MTTIEYIALTFLVTQEGKYFVSECRELGTSSFGEDEKEAFKNLRDATEVYLNTLKDLGEDKKVLREKGVKIFSYEPADLEVRRARFPVGSTVSPVVMPVPA